MKLAVLFWFYKAFDVCESRLKLLRKLNPGVPIYGLYGGPIQISEEAQRRLGDWLNDFYCYQEDREASWKWRNGDQMIADWHRHRGSSLPWDTIVVVQWDMLILRPLANVFAMLEPGQVLLSGFRPSHEVQDWWGWLKEGNSEKSNDRDAFLAWLRHSYGYTGELWCCLFIVVCLPRRFLEAYVAAGPPKVGFLEYKVPTLAKIFGIPVSTNHSFRPWWASNPATRDAPIGERSLNAVGEEIRLELVLTQVLTGSGSGVLHPYRRPLSTWLIRRPFAWAALNWIRRWRDK